MSLDPDKIKALMKKIPELKVKQNTRVFLSGTFFRKLNDDEFTTLWYMPGMEIMVSKPTRQYIEQRRRGLKLEKSRHTGDKKLKL